MRKVSIIEHLIESLNRFLVTRIEREQARLLGLGLSVFLVFWIATFDNVPFQVSISVISFLVFLILLLVHRYWMLERIIRQDPTRYISKSRIHNAPGSYLLALVDFLFSPKIIEQTFKPLVADWQHEYFEALKQNRKWKARWISVRYRCAFVWAMSLSKAFSLWKQIKSASK